MNDIKEIFYGQYTNKSPIIKTIGVDTDKHKVGIYNIAKFFNKNYSLDQNNLKAVFNTLFLYFTGSQESDLDLSKGILLIGNVGSGKTLIMQILLL